MSVSETVLNELEKVTGTDQVHKDLNLDLFGEKILEFVRDRGADRRALGFAGHRNFSRRN